MIGNVVWTIADRPHYTRETLGYWTQVRGVNDWHHAFFVEPGPHAQEQIDILTGAPFPNMSIVVNERRMGVLTCAWNALEHGFNGNSRHGIPEAEFVVLAEEDLAVSDDVLECFDQLSSSWQCTPALTGAICMSGRYTQAQGASLSDFLIEAGTEFDSHIWGTWRSVWTKYLRDSWDHDYSSGDPSGWDWNMSLRVLPDNDLSVVKPAISRADNLGQFGGVHQQPHEYEASRPPEFNRHVESRELRVL